MVSFVWPPEVETIPKDCFRGCRLLSDFRFDDGTYWAANEREIESWAFYECGEFVNFSLPHTVDWVPKICLNICEQMRDGHKVTIVPLKDSRKGTCGRHVSDWLLDLSEFETVPSNLVSGGSGFVRLFKRKADGRLVVGKFLNIREYGEDQTMFEREICNLIAVEHTNEGCNAYPKWRYRCHKAIVPFVGYTPPCRATEGHFAIFTEFVPGGSLSDFIGPQSTKRNQLDSTALVKIIVGIVLGMRHVHRHGIVHRDLKLSNVLLNEQHHPLICDFGSSRSLVAESTTLTGAPQVTIYYAAPELSEEDAQYDYKADVYSFGVMLYEIVTGQLAFRHLNSIQVTRFVLSGKRPEIPGNVLPFTRGLIEWCWSGNPSDRPSFDEIFSELQRQKFRIFRNVNSRDVSKYAHSLFDPKVWRNFISI